MAGSPVSRPAVSMQIQLSWWLASAIVGVALLAGALSFAFAYHEAHEIQDNVLQQMGQFMGEQAIDGRSGQLSGPLIDGDGESRLRVSVLRPGDTDTVALHRDGTLRLPDQVPNGLQTLNVQGQSYRVWVQPLVDGRRLVVAQSQDFRDELARGNALSTVLPFLGWVALLWLMVARLVRHSFRPMTALAQALNQRAYEDGQALPVQSLPTEIQPFVQAINQMLQRVSAVLQAQQRFIADAAHELRTPLTALSLQADRLSRAELSAEASSRLHTLREGIARSQRLVSQLLTLARIQSTDTGVEAPTAVRSVCVRVLEDLWPLAESRAFDIGLTGEHDAWLELPATDLYLAVKNLVHNALQHTPAGGRIDLALACVQGGVQIRVCDTGPGIPEAQRERVLEAFYRLPGGDEQGSGLGLSIVHSVVQRHQGRIGLHTADPASGTGLCVELFFPVASATPAPPRPA